MAGWAGVHDNGDKPGNGSEMPTPVNVTFPVLVAVNVYPIVSPTADTDDLSTTFTNDNPGVRVAGTVTELDGANGGPVGGVPVPVAVLPTAPESRSAWVT